MKIASVESIQLRIPLAGESRLEIGSWGGKGLPTVDSLIVKVVTDTGLVGWGGTFGFAGIPAARAAIDSILAPALVGRDAALLEKLTLDLQKQFHIFGRSGAVIFGLSAIDIALCRGSAAAKCAATEAIVPCLACSRFPDRTTDERISMGCTPRTASP
ncbi:hypothetical protein [Paraburkholderia hospita]|uniref:hypothetical protein n=1 Tax=Paraburkholderia hospita TaxID=169430 RepID=UPI0009A7204F|nr:hypothetical protein [Paraburkholderia hospita]SKD05535.1 Mandelate racemase / muconate lactonizing enzyme, N-terminal domain [Paraburkholderia hospita]